MIYQVLINQRQMHKMVFLSVVFAISARYESEATKAAQPFKAVCETVSMMMDF
jgi:hypothetical protein